MIPRLSYCGGEHRHQDKTKQLEFSSSFALEDLWCKDQTVFLYQIYLCNFETAELDFYEKIKSVVAAFWECEYRAELVKVSHLRCFGRSRTWCKKENRNFFKQVFYHNLKPSNWHFAEKTLHFEYGRKRFRRLGQIKNDSICCCFWTIRFLMQGSKYVKCDSNPASKVYSSQLSLCWKFLSL